MEGYDAPTDAQFAINLAAPGMLSLLLQLFGISEANGLLVQLWQALKVKLVHLDRHPARGDIGEALTDTFELLMYFLKLPFKKKAFCVEINQNVALEYLYVHVQLVQH